MSNLTKNEYKTATIVYRNYFKHVADTEKMLVRLQAEMRVLEKQIADYENHCLAEGSDDANDKD